jgi:hypothetical protein
MDGLFAADSNKPGFVGYLDFLFQGDLKANPIKPFIL